MATQFDYQLNPPKRVKQAKYATCWAAAFESILDATANSNKKTEKELVDQYGAAWAGGGISPANLETVAKGFGFLFNTFLDKTEARVFSDKFVRDRLKQSGAILAAAKITTTSPPWYHAQVIWGVRYLTDGDAAAGNAILDTMNPADGQYAIYPLSYFTGNTPAFTCWRNAGNASP